MIPPSSWEVYLVTDRAFSRGRSTLEIVRAAVRGGVSAVQLREKELSTRDFLEEGLTIRDFLRERGVPLIINDRIDIALALDAEGVHVGQNDMPVGIARKLLGRSRIVGLSAERLDHLDRDAGACIDYFAVSPVFLTGTKTDISRPWGLDGLKNARAATDLPLVAIGSIKVDNAREVVRAGADCVAVVTAIVSADDPEAACRRLLEEVRAGKAERRASGTDLPG